MLAENSTADLENKGVRGQNDLSNDKVSPVLSKAVKISPKLTRLKSFRRGLSKRSLLSSGRLSPCRSPIGNTNSGPQIL